MKSLHLFSVIACSLAVLSEPALALERETCCTRTNTVGKVCEPNSRETARKDGKVCEKCSGKKETKEDK